MKYCTDTLSSGSETGSQSCMEAGKLQDVNMHLLALGHCLGSPRHPVALNEPHRAVFWVWGWFFTLLDPRTHLVIN